jgi:hypothetical protein
MSVELTFLSPEAPEADVLRAIEALAINVPRLSETALVEAAFSYFNLSPSKGKRLAEAVVQDLKDDDKRRAWIEQRCLEMLRSRIALIHPQLAQLAAKTPSRTIKSAIISKVYAALASTYPQLADAAAEACARKQLALPPPEPAKEESPNSALSPKGIEVNLGPDEEEKDQDSNWKLDHKQPETPEAQVRQLTDLALVCLKAVSEHLLPAAAKENIAMDPPTVQAWSMTIFLAISRKELVK